MDDAERDVAQAIAPVVAAPSGRRRRPSGEPPPLPRHIARSTPWYAVALTLTLALELALAVPAAREAVTRVDNAVIRALGGLRAETVNTAMRGLEHLGSPAAIRTLTWATIALLVVARRGRHLLAYLLVGLSVALVANWLALLQGRMRPAGVHILGTWSGYAHPSVPVAMLAAALAGLLYTTLPRGRWRNHGKWVAGAAVAGLCCSRMMLAVDHPSDVLAALAIGWAFPVIAYRLMTPDEAFPITYRHTQRAHLDVGGERGRAIVTALDAQLGIQTASVEPFGLAGSAGSTPLRIRVNTTDGAESDRFAKLYALSHLRSDRSYKWLRMVLYGRLEDEKPFSTVRRLGEYEDHMLRLLRDTGLPVPRPQGLVEITPEREYLVVMEFIDGAHEIGAEPAREPDIDAALGIVRQLWHAGVAHRDIKPSNVLVRDGRAYLIDVAFATVRPTPWRQAVDLANMMLTLGLSSSAELVYERAIRIFAPEDVAEAFAASRSVTIPTQLRARLHADGRDLVGRFRALAPARRPVAIQLWTLRRLAATLTVALAVALACASLYAYARLAGLL
jgi:tRNA A-37 threonylcarbamoyl transferase component Bud32/membrane-associated phospholipid phosphatase